VSRVAAGHPAEVPSELSGLESAARYAHRLRLEAAASCVSTIAECSSASALPPRRALRLVGTSDAEMRRTDLCHFTLIRTGTRVSSVSGASGDCSLARSVTSPASRQCNSLRRVAQLTIECHRGGRCLPVAVCADRASDTPVASPASTPGARAPSASARAAKVAPNPPA